IRSAKSAAAAHPESADELRRLEELLTADRKWRRGSSGPPPFPQSPRIFFEAETLYAGRAHPPPSPAALRLELQGLKLVGRLSEFEPRLDEALGSAAPGSVERLRYQSLRLKYLEELRDWPRLFAELEEMTADPPVDDPRGRALFLSSAKSYEARLRLASGDPARAEAAYSEAALLLSGVPDTEDRRSEILREIAGLRAANPTAAPSPEAPAASAAREQSSPPADTP
ncbi:MAG: hypothetical protein LBW85_02300, partial [Deltaproteobacteria bacterium]|nr:hypothetical protein [Deltaproteobacteria bacterium]